MDTITFKHSGQAFEVPLVVAFDKNGPTDLIGDVEPENCNHSGSSWSSCLDLRCAHCGARLFLPPRLLAGRSEDDIDEMYSLWVRAGWPAWDATDQHWAGTKGRWTIIDHPLFRHVGGLAIRNDRLPDHPMWKAWQTQPAVARRE